MKGLYAGTPCKVRGRPNASFVFESLCSSLCTRARRFLAALASSSIDVRIFYSDPSLVSYRMPRNSAYGRIPLSRIYSYLSDRHLRRFLRLSRSCLILSTFFLTLVYSLSSFLTVSLCSCSSSLRDLSNVCAAWVASPVRRECFWSSS
jgi:hypothetical protein